GRPRRARRSPAPRGAATGPRAARPDRTRRRDRRGGGPHRGCQPAQHGGGDGARPRAAGHARRGPVRGRHPAGGNPRPAGLAVPGGGTPLPPQPGGVSAVILRALLALLLLATSAAANPVRIKDLVEFDGVRGNDLVGYGL